MKAVLVTLPVVGAVTVGHVIMGVIIAGAVLTARAAAQKAKPRSQARDFKSSGHLLNTTSQSEPIPIPYGTCRIGGNIVYKHCTGTDNKYFHRIITFGFGPVQGIKQDGQGDKIWLDDKRIQEFGSLAYWEFFTGISTQNVCATLQAAHPAFDDAMRDTAYLYLRLEYDSEKFASEPQVTIELEGRLLYDPRDNQTKFTGNNALVAYDFLRSDLYSIGLPSDVFDEDMIKDAANWCDANGYEFNGPIMDRQSLLDNFEIILQNFRAGLPWSEGLYKLFVYEYDTPVMTLTEDDIETDSFRIVGPGIPETPNRCLVTYMDAVNNYVSKTKPVEDPTAVITYDGEERDFELDLKGTTNALQAEKLGYYYVERNRLNLQFPLVAHPRALELDPMDMIQITHSLPGWTQKIVRVLDAEERQDGRVNLLLLAELSSLYDDDVDVAEHNAYETNLPDLFNILPSGSIEIEEELYITRDGAGVKTMAKLSWGPSPTIWVREYQIEYRKFPDEGYSIAGKTSDTIFTIFDVDPGIYDFRIKAFSGLGIPSEYSFRYNIEIYGLLAPPAQITGLTITAIGGLAIIRWTRHPDLDVRIGGSIIFRHSKMMSGADWNEAVSIGDAVPGSDTIAILPLKSGSYLLKARDSSGTLSEEAAVIVTDAATHLAFGDIDFIDEHPTFLGTHDRTVVDEGNLKILDGYYHGTNPKPPYKLLLESGDTILLEDGSHLVGETRYWDEYWGGIYTFAAGFDFGSPRRVRLSTLIFALTVDEFDLFDDRLANIDEWLSFDGEVAGQGDCQVWVRKTDDDPNGSPVWSGWDRLDSGEFKSRACQFQARLFVSDPAFNVYVDELTVKAEEDLTIGAEGV
jgi:hypothetical protein